MPMQSLSKDIRSNISPIMRWDKKVYTFSKFIGQNENVVERLEFELAFYDVSVQYVNHCTTEILQYVPENILVYQVFFLCSLRVFSRKY